MRSLVRVYSHALIAVLFVACAQPTLVSCPEGEVPCGASCVELVTEENCGACGRECASGTSCVAGVCQPDSLCAINNGGCGPDALCFDNAGVIDCQCMPGMTGDGQTCTACTMCGSSEFASTPCSPTSDAVCTTCTQGCFGGTYEAMPCGPFNDLVCSPCTQCGPGQYPMGECGPVQNTQCGTCAVGCTLCFGPGATCSACELGLVLSEGMCVPAICGNGVIESGEICDDGDMASGNGCSSTCQLEADHYCFGNGPSICRPGGCVFEPATALPLGAAFELDGVATMPGGGLLLTQRSMIRTTANVTYPVLIEADVLYSGADITYAGTRGDGLRDVGALGEPTNTLRARLSPSSVELATGPNITVIASTSTPFTPSMVDHYRVRYVDDGFMASVEWFNLTNPSEGIALNMPTSFHGTADRAFVGGGDQGAVTISNVRVCSAPALPVTAGLAARYSAIPSWTVNRDPANIVSGWQDLSGNARHLSENGPSALYNPSLINGHAGLDFTGSARLATAPFALTTDVTVFAVIQHRSPQQWGAIAHHGHRDDDWSMESTSATSDVLHMQTNNDNTNVEVTLVTNENYIMTGRLDGLDRYFSATAFSGTSPAPAAFTDASSSITTGSKPLYVGSSSNSEASNAFIGELVYYNRALSDVERDAVITYLRDLWRTW